MSRSSAKKNKDVAPPRIGPGSTYESVPDNVARHMKRYSNRIEVDLNTVSIKVVLSMAIVKQKQF